MRLILLSERFYNEYGNCREILKKENRPYASFAVEIEGHVFAIPLRHHIHHKYAFFTIGECGLDFTKSVIIDNKDYVANDTPWIDSNEWRILQRNEDKIIYSFRKYIRQFKRAQKHPDNPRSKAITRYSSLNYFDL